MSAEVKIAETMAKIRNATHHPFAYQRKAFQLQQAFEQNIILLHFQPKGFQNRTMTLLTQTEHTD